MAGPGRNSGSGVPVHYVEHTLKGRRGRPWTQRWQRCTRYSHTMSKQSGGAAVGPGHNGCSGVQVHYEQTVRGRRP